MHIHLHIRSLASGIPLMPASLESNASQNNTCRQNANPDGQRSVPSHQKQQNQLLNPRFNLPVSASRHVAHTGAEQTRSLDPWVVFRYGADMAGYVLERHSDAIIATHGDHNIILASSD